MNLNRIRDASSSVEESWRQLKEAIQTTEEQTLKARTKTKNISTKSVKNRLKRETKEANI